MSSDRPFRLGARGSALARWQADWVADRLRALGHAVEVIEIRTSGDAQQVGPIHEIVGGGGQGVFTKEIQRALLDERIDLAVHSLKDLPTTPVEGLAVAATPERAPIADAFISNAANSIDELPQGARIGTGSFRRKAQLLNRRPDLVIGDLRGNVDTRLRKLDEGEHEAILLAEAGLTRLGLTDRITQRVPLEVLLPAPGQGALGVECRGSDDRTREAVGQLNHSPTHAAVTAERTALARLEGGCLAALGAWGRIDSGQLKLRVVVLSEDGQQRLDSEAIGDPDHAAELGASVAEDLLSRGAADLLCRRS